MAIRSSTSPTTSAGKDARLIFEQWAPTRDGSKLHYIVYLPRELTTPVPAIIELTPYCLDRRHGDGVYFASRNFAFVLADVRGRGDSPGEWSFMQDDGDDGYDLIQHIASQPWCSGKVGLYGSSYTGANQWVIASRCPPALGTIVPSAAGHLGMDVPVGGIPTSYYFRWRASTAGNQQYFNMFSDSAMWHAQYAETVRETGRLAPLPERINIAGTDTRKQFESPDFGPIWGDILLRREQLAAMNIPILCVGGQYDGTQLGHLRLYRDFDRHGPATARANLCLLMGPWDHSGIMPGTDRVGDLQFDAQAKVDVRALKADWYDWTLRDRPRPEFLSERVKYYVTGAERWRDAKTLQAITRDTQTLYLSSNGEASDVFHSGSLTSQIGGALSDTFRVNPRDTRPSEIELRQRDIDSPPVGPGTGGSNYWVPWNDFYFVTIGEQPTNQAFAIHLCGHGVVYHSAQLDDALELAGCPEVALYLSFDVPSIDLMAFLFEVLPDGGSIFLSSQILRLRRENGAAPQKVAFDGMRFFARTLARNSRLRCLIRSPSSHSFERKIGRAHV